MKRKVKKDVKSSNMAHQKLSNLCFKKNQESVKSGKKEDLIALTKFLYHGNVVDMQTKKGRLLTKREKEDLYCLSAHTVYSTIVFSGK